MIMFLMTRAMMMMMMMRGIKMMWHLSKTSRKVESDRPLASLPAILEPSKSLKQWKQNNRNSPLRKNCTCLHDIPSGICRFEDNKKQLNKLMFIIIKPTRCVKNSTCFMLARTLHGMLLLIDSSRPSPPSGCEASSKK